jgi:hypothetical protein
MRRFALAGVLAVFAVVTTHANPPIIPTAYTFTTFAVPAASNTFAMGINDRGDIVGSYVDGGHYYGFVKRGKRYTRLLNVNEATGINRVGDIVGWYAGPNNAGFHGFLIQHGNTSPVDVPGAYFTVAYGVNDFDQVVGYFNAYDADGLGNRGFVMTGTSARIIAVPGADYTQVQGINNQGVAVGSYSTDLGATVHGFLTSDGGITFRNIDPPGSRVTLVAGVNDQGQTVGWYVDAAGAHGFVANGDRFTPFNAANGSPMFASGINNRGEIVGYGDGGSFLATPLSR